MDAKAVKTEAGNTVRLIKIRNPWGDKGWTGDWSYKCKKWTKKMREELEYVESKENEDNGIFWMEVKDFKKEFS